MVREAFGITKEKINDEERSNTRSDSETSEDGEASIVRSCTIGDEGEEIATDNGIQMEVAMDKSSVINGAEDFSAPVLRTSAVVPVCQRETRETEADGGKRKARHEEEEDRG